METTPASRSDGGVRDRVRLLLEEREADRVGRDDGLRSSMRSPNSLSPSSPSGVCGRMGSRPYFWTSMTFSRSCRVPWPAPPGWARAQVLEHLALHARELVDDLDHVHRDTDGAGLVGHGAGDGLTDPPGGVRGALVALDMVRNFSTARIRPGLPSWMRSRKSMPRPVWRLAGETTSRRLASRRWFLARRPSSAMISSSRLSFGGELVGVRQLVLGEQARLDALASSRPPARR